MARLRGKGREGWSVEEHSWVCNEGPTVAGHGLRGAVVGWYLPVLVVDEKRLSRDGVRVVVMVKRVAVGKASRGFEHAVGIRSRKEWFRHKMTRSSWWAYRSKGAGWWWQRCACWWRGRRSGGDGQDR